MYMVRSQKNLCISVLNVITMKRNLKKQMAEEHNIAFSWVAKIASHLSRNSIQNVRQPDFLFCIVNYQITLICLQTAHGV